MACSALYVISIAYKCAYVNIWLSYGGHMSTPVDNLLVTPGRPGPGGRGRAGRNTPGTLIGHFWAVFWALHRRKSGRFMPVLGLLSGFWGAYRLLVKALLDGRRQVFACQRWAVRQGGADPTGGCRPAAGGKGEGAVPPFRCRHSPLPPPASGRTSGAWALAAAPLPGAKKPAGAGSLR